MHKLLNSFPDLTSHGLLIVIINTEFSHGDEDIYNSTYESNKYDYFDVRLPPDSSKEPYCNQVDLLIQSFIFHNYNLLVYIPQEA